MMDLHQAMMDVDPNYAKTDLAQTDPAVRAALEEMILDHERRWLDDSIPALGGRTPREAAEDPFGREELEQLLATFDSLTPDSPGMDPDRSRNALGL